MTRTTDRPDSVAEAPELPATPARAQAALEEVLEVGRLSPAARAFVAAIASRADLPMRLARMALVFRSREAEQDARALARAAHRLAPNDHRIRVMTDWLQRREAPLWHFRIVHDELRNAEYAEALRRFVQPGMTVFEIGTGTGILAMLAAQAGAAHVYTCERRGDVAEAARSIIARNGFAERITVIEKDAHDVRVGQDMPHRADLFVAEIVDTSLLGEGVLDLTELARARLLTPDAILIPRAVSAVGALVTGRGQWQRYRMDRVMGFDLTPFNRFTPVEMVARGGGAELELLTDDIELAHFDLRQNAPDEAQQRKAFTANGSGSAEAILRWLRLDFGDGILFENRPPQHSCWDPVLHILPRPHALSPGDRFSVEVRHTRDRLFLWPTEEPAV